MSLRLVSNAWNAVLSRYKIPVNHVDNCDSVAIVIARHRNVSSQARGLHDRSAWITAWNDAPLAARRPPNGEIGLSVAIVVARHRDVPVVVGFWQ